MLRWPKLTIGLGASVPATLISKSFLSRRRNTCTFAPPVQIRQWFKGAPRRNFCRNREATPSRNQMASNFRLFSSIFLTKGVPFIRLRGFRHRNSPLEFANGMILLLPRHSPLRPQAFGQVWCSFQQPQTDWLDQDRPWMHQEDRFNPHLATNSDGLPSPLPGTARRLHPRRFSELLREYLMVPPVHI